MQKKILLTLNDYQKKNNFIQLGFKSPFESSCYELKLLAVTIGNSVAYNEKHLRRIYSRFI